MMKCWKSMATCVGLAAAVGLSPHASADFALNSHFGLNIHDGRIITENWVSGEGYLGQQRVFAQMLDPNSFWMDDLATNSVGGTFATPGEVGFNFLDELRVWDSSAQDFTSTDHTITKSFGPGGLLSATTGDGFVAGYTTAVRDENSHPNSPDQWGRHHVHSDWTLNAPLGDPNDGIYLVTLEWFYEPGAGNDTTYDTSLPTYAVIGLNQSMADLEFAVNWVIQNIVPTPGALALFGVVGFIGAGRRRRY